MSSISDKVIQHSNLIDELIKKDKVSQAFPSMMTWMFLLDRNCNEEKLNHISYLCVFSWDIADRTIRQQEVTDFFYPIDGQFSLPIAIS